MNVGSIICAWFSSRINVPSGCMDSKIAPFDSHIPRRVFPLLFFLVHSSNHLPIGWRSTLKHSVGAYMETGFFFPSVLFFGALNYVWNGWVAEFWLKASCIIYSRTVWDMVFWLIGTERRRLVASRDTSALRASATFGGIFTTELLFSCFAMHSYSSGVGIQISYHHRPRWIWDRQPYIPYLISFFAAFIITRHILPSRRVVYYDIDLGDGGCHSQVHR